MIVKNEEKNLPRCLASLRGVVDEIVVIDTGSADRTVEIAREAGAILGAFPWNGNEADARNASIQAATGRWLFMIDADEEVSPALAKELPEVVEKLEAQPEYNSLSVLFRNRHLGGESSLTRLIRIGRNRPGYGFAGMIHATCNYHLETWALQGALEHYGYQWTDEQRQKKARHMIEHLSPLCAGEKPPLKSLCELMSYLLLAGDRPGFERRWRQALSYSCVERTGGPHAAYWYDNLSNILQFFAARDDWEAGRAAAEETADAQPGHVAATFYLLQAAVKAGDWPRVEALADRLLHADLTVEWPWNTVFPEKQFVPARAWHWLAQIEQGKSSDRQLPEDFNVARLTPVILAAQEKIGTSLASANPALTQVLPLLFLAQNNPPPPAACGPLLAKLERLQARQETGSLPYSLASLAKCALLQKTGQIKPMTDELKALTEIYGSHAWFRQGTQDVAARQEFALESFSRRVAHLS